MPTPNNHKPVPAWQELLLFLAALYLLIGGVLFTGFREIYLMQHSNIFISWHTSFFVALWKALLWPLYVFFL